MEHRPPHGFDQVRTSCAAASMKRITSVSFVYLDCGWSLRFAPAQNEDGDVDMKSSKREILSVVLFRSDRESFPTPIQRESLTSEALSHLLRITWSHFEASKGYAITT